MRDRPLVRASDIGLWAFCRRAWWLTKVRGVEHQRPAQLARGVAAHQAHGHAVQRAQSSMTLGWSLLALGMILAGIMLFLSVLQ